MAKAHIGTSGWQYGNWRGSLYPENLPQKDWLRYYSKYFDTVEVNSSFYRQTKASTFKKWQEQTPKGFTFAVKGHRYITHVRLLKEEVKESVELFFRNAGVLKGGHVILWQLPPRLKKNIERLEGFLNLLPKNHRHAFEFRHESWVSKDTWQALLKGPVESAVVLQDWRDWPILEEPVGKFVYVRFHGKEKLYHSSYSDRELKRWARKFLGWQDKGLDIYAYFNNDAEGHAAPNALRLKDLVGVERG